MDEKELEKKWNAMMKQTFDRFVTENIGFKPAETTPECFGSGDARPWCKYCPYQSGC